MKEIHTDSKNYSLHLIGTNILYLKYLDKAELTLETVKEINNHGLNFLERKPFFSVVDLRDMFGHMTDEAKEFVATNEETNSLRICESLLVNNLPIRLLVNGYLQYNKPQSETKVFSKAHKCVDWLSLKGCSEENLEMLKTFI